MKNRSHAQFRPFQFDVCFTGALTLYFAKMIYKCKLVGVVSKERMRT